MNGRIICGLCVWAALICVSAPAWGQGAPVVSNVSASQRPDDSMLIDIHYDLADESLCTVWILVSDDGGTTWNVPAQSFTGDIGANTPAGPGKHIVWDAGADIPGRAGSLKARVMADDGNGQANMVFVSAGSFPYQGGPYTYVAAFWIDKYEVTNLRYCEFLNAADADGDCWTHEMEITRHGEPGSYTYAVDAGRQNYPARWVSHTDAVCFANWLSMREGRNYRLPTEEEWEKAAGWDPDEQHLYSYGYHLDGSSCDFCNFNNCVGTATEVGHYSGGSGTGDGKSFYGCYDMSGNVWEWTSGTAGSGVVMRGGSWDSDHTQTQTTYRAYNPAPDVRDTTYGFRLVLDLEQGS